MRAPVVAVTATTEVVRGAPRVRLNEAYVRAIESVGLIPLLVPPFTDATRATVLLQAVAGLVLTGGEDIDPARYGQAPHAALGAVHVARDATELALARGAAAWRMPTLAICRGVQLVAVSLGGTLVQDLPSEWPGAVDHAPDVARGTLVHDVAVEPESRLARALGATQVRVNSSHHQAVRDPGPALRATGHAPDGVIEAVEPLDSAWWMLGVQWHAEEPIGAQSDTDVRLFTEFAGAVRAALR